MTRRGVLRAGVAGAIATGFGVGGLTGPAAGRAQDDAPDVPATAIVDPGEQSAENAFTFEIDLSDHDGEDGVVQTVIWFSSESGVDASTIASGQISASVDGSEITGQAWYDQDDLLLVGHHSEGAFQPTDVDTLTIVVDAVAVPNAGEFTAELQLEYTDENDDAVTVATAAADYAITEGDGESGGDDGGSEEEGEGSWPVEDCTNWSEFDVGDEEFVLVNNKWGNADAEQCIRVHEDGSYGWSFEGGSQDGDDINYPQVYCGNKGDASSGVPEFPLTRGEVDELIMEYDVSLDVEEGSYNLAEEWWLVDGEPGDDPNTHEIMLVCNWGGGHGEAHGEEAELDAIEDQFGNTIHYWQLYDGEGWDHDFHIFKLDSAAETLQVDLKEILDYLTEEADIDEDLTMPGIELGTETFGGPTGEVTFDQFDVTINGTTYQSGAGTSVDVEPGGDEEDFEQPDEQQPYLDSPHEVPGRVQAQHFDLGGQDVAFHEETESNQGGDFRTGEPVDVEETADDTGEYNVGYVDPDEWLEYTVDVQTAGEYELDARVASDWNGGAFDLSIEDGDPLVSVDVPVTDGWQEWETVTSDSFDLEAGEQTLRLAVDLEEASFNLNWFEFTLLEEAEGSGDGGDEDGSGGSDEDGSGGSDEDGSDGSDDGDGDDEDTLPGMGLGAALTSLGGASYVLSRRLGSEDDEEA